MEVGDLEQKSVAVFTDGGILYHESCWEWSLVCVQTFHLSLYPQKVMQQLVINYNVIPSYHPRKECI